MTTTAPTIFNFRNSQVRVIVREGEPWFVATDVCAALGYKNSRDAVATHLDDDEKGVANGYTLGGNQSLAIIFESGLYALVLRSRKPEARKFAKWVTSEVLPAIRKTGRYETESINPLRLKDFIISFDRDGKMQLREAPPPKSYQPEELIEKWFEPNSYPFDSEFLHRLATVCLNRLWQRLYITREEKRTGKTIMQFGCPMPKKAGGKS
jgi:prophage antirepressor-like protein